MRTVLLGMNQPVRDAEPLDPRIPNSSGNRLWKMLSEVLPCTEEEFRSWFERENVLDTSDWSLVRARARGEELRRRLQGRRVVILGIGPLRALELERPDWCDWRESCGVSYCLVPHPSGLNHLYNDEVVRHRVGHLLAGEVFGSAGSMTGSRAEVT